MLLARFTTRANRLTLNLCTPTAIHWSSLQCCANCRVFFLVSISSVPLNRFYKFDYWSADAVKFEWAVILMNSITTCVQTLRPLIFLSSFVNHVRVSSPFLLDRHDWKQPFGWKSCLGDSNHLGTAAPPIVRHKHGDAVTEIQRQQDHCLYQAAKLRSIFLVRFQVSFRLFRPTGFSSYCPQNASLPAQVFDFGR